MIDSIFDVTFHLDTKYSLHHTQHIQSITLQGVDHNDDRPNSCNYNDCDDGDDGDDYNYYRGYNGDGDGDESKQPTIKPPSYPSQSIDHKKDTIRTLLKSFTARPQSTITVAIRTVFAGQVARLIDQYELDPQSIDTLVINNLFPQPFQTMIELLPDNNHIKTLDLRVLNPNRCCDRDYFKYEDEEWMESLTRELFGRCTNITSLAIYDQCGSADSAYAMYIVGQDDQFFAHLDQLEHLESLTFNLSPSCGHDHVDILEEQGQSFVNSLTSFMRRHPTLHTFDFVNILPRPNAPAPEYLPLMQYLFSDVNCSVQHLTLNITQYIKVPMLCRTIDSLNLRRMHCDYREASWDYEMSMISNLKTMVTNTLDLSHFELYQPATGHLVTNEFRLGLFIGELYKPPTIYSKGRYNQYADQSLRIENSTTAATHSAQPSGNQ
ncbi:hypothetical protein SAMD00019534_062880 [Acytostelium subglobosum LB1]|uniref:hypothetical protein n=1 Tax=Acytostelium subglobosum LB1 TaxID=1410327 RepID=UPI000644FC69|nr:hypothetical protein SAMD00019534_062880 [Acytostelium subglobosum LB1]GAM23113.1 hypothetical protein SAMD00019534_062880 [Acytostelium subglobosum LB1]|eukprot:XP_012754340.1 hypothetical protein SAMD00019534_062880 [Acytostelium subglobosum LB1]